MPTRLAAEWELRISCRCECGRSSVPQVGWLLDRRPDLAHLRICDAAERLVCKECSQRYKRISIQDKAPTGAFNQWEVLDRTSSAYQWEHAH